MLIGTMMSILLLGIMMIQTYIYFESVFFPLGYCICGIKISLRTPNVADATKSIFLD